jgi:MYXO-CTERM domain-containing protein
MKKRLMVAAAALTLNAGCVEPPQMGNCLAEEDGPADFADCRERLTSYMASTKGAAMSPPPPMAPPEDIFVVTNSRYELSSDANDAPFDFCADGDPMIPSLAYAPDGSQQAMASCDSAGVYTFTETLEGGGIQTVADPDDIWDYVSPTFSLARDESGELSTLNAFGIGTSNPASSYLWRLGRDSSAEQWAKGHRDHAEGGYFQPIESQYDADDGGAYAIASSLAAGPNYGDVYTTAYQDLSSNAYQLKAASLTGVIPGADADSPTWEMLYNGTDHSTFPTHVRDGEAMVILTDGADAWYENTLPRLVELDTTTQTEGDEIGYIENDGLTYPYFAQGMVFNEENCTLSLSVTNWFEEAVVLTITDTEDPNCAEPIVDNDGDGVPEDEDCDDDNPDVGGPEGGLFIDGDLDGVGGEEVVDCDDGSYVSEGGDCDDSNPDVYPGAPEECVEEGVTPADLDCDGVVQEECPPVEPVDEDGDRYYSEEDCDDTDAQTHPGAYEEDCSTDPDVFGIVDRDCDGETIPECAEPGVVGVTPGSCGGCETGDGPEGAAAAFALLLLALGRRRDATAEALRSRG